MVPFANLYVGCWWQNSTTLVQDNFARMTDDSMLKVFYYFNYEDEVKNWIQFPRKEIQWTLQTFSSGIT